MKNELITNIEQEMVSYLDNAQMKHLKEVLKHCFFNVSITIEEQKQDKIESNEKLLESFLSSKKVEGCSYQTLKYYKNTIESLQKIVDKHFKHMQTDDLRYYLDCYQKKNNASKVTLDNARRILSSFFSWLEDEDYILKSPVRRIHKIRGGKTIKETYSDESLEIMRDNCENLRDLALVDFLASTAMRVGELVKLDRNDIDFDNRECSVFGKGDKERKVYFDARTKVHLKNYLDSRTDNTPALFVSLLAPYNRLLIRGVEIRLKELGDRLNINKVHPHKFRRTTATSAIDKGMPIEQVKEFLGHTKIDTTLQYAMVNEDNVKISHRKFIC